MLPIRAVQNAPIERKLMIITMLATTAALLLTGAGIVVHGHVQARHDLVERMGTTARILGDNTAAALSFDDVTAAEETLQSLHALDEISLAAVYDRGGKLFAQYRAGAVSRDEAPPAAPEASGHCFRSGSLVVFRDIILAGERIGTIHLRVNLDGLERHFEQSLAWAAAATLAAWLLAWVLAKRLTPVVSGPVMQLARVVRMVGTDRNYAVRAVKRSDDELGRLVDDFNDMLAQIEAREAALREARDGLERHVRDRAEALEQEADRRRRAEAELAQLHRLWIEASCQAGMAEVATNVLQDVGNILNSVAVSANLLAENLQNSRVARVAQIARLLQDHEVDLASFVARDPRGKELPGNLARLAGQLASEHEGTVRELRLLRRQVDHLGEIVAMQQDYASGAGAKEPVDLRALVRQSLRLNAGAMARDGVALEEAYGEVPAVSVDKGRVLQIVVNLVRNAHFACVEADRPDKRVRVSVSAGGGYVRIAVADNGIGIEAAQLARVFSQGFTTRKGSRGFGLHCGALAARELGGSLQVHSDGPGRGAEFVLEVPVS